MKFINKLVTVAVLATLSACASTNPEIVPDNTSDSVILKKINHEIQSGEVFKTGWQWILWYLPFLFLVVSWGWRQFIRMPISCDEPCPEEKKAEVKPEQPANTTGAGTPPSA